MARRAAPGNRRPPRPHAAHVQGSGGGTFRGRPGARGLRDRDAGPRHQLPARTVVIERLDKWNGETHADLTPGEYTQLTGPAGRRGIDVEGHAVVLWQPGTDPMAVAGLAGTRT